jgi:UPF0755 protein
MRIRLRYIALLLIIAGIAYTGWMIRTLDTAWSAPGPLMQEKLVYIPPGGGAKTISAQLTASGILTDAPRFRILTRINSMNGGLKAGEYLFTPQISIGGIIKLLQSGKTYQHKITIAEGLTSAEIATLINAAAAMTGTAEAPAEGSLLPETYSYSYGDARATLITRMQKSMQDTLSMMWASRAADFPLKTPQEAVTLASIVEKETGLPLERPRIAGVFFNRLKTGMLLQSDPTVIYAVTLGQRKLDRPLTRKDLGTPSPYNTYMTAGLPPAPIANPGEAALEAVMHPESHDYLYFVADGSGGHVFSRSLSEHTHNVGKWREIEKKSNH